MQSSSWFFAVYKSLAIFVIFAFLGWVVEVIYSLYDDKKFVNRGFLLGPVCPIYGFAVLLISVCLSPLTSHPVFLFVCSSILVSLLELMTGVLLERLFKQKWWDYSHRRFNFKGYVCLGFSLIWGLGCLLVVYLLLPFCSHILTRLPVSVGCVLLAAALVLMAVDFSITVCSISQIRKYLSGIKKQPYKISARIKHLSKTFSNLKSVVVFPNNSERNIEDE